jgi:pimeloyl-ACP methyl ester carboxylesterase
LRTVSVPTLIMVGDSDQLTPPELAEEMAGLIAGAELIVVNECGHLPVLEHPKLATTALREWLGA